MKKALHAIVEYIRQEREVDFSVFRATMLERRIEKRLHDVRCANLDDYLALLHDTPEELDHLFDILTINVSRFFRNTLAFAFLAERVLPAILAQKRDTHGESLRVWSAGCAAGEEPYSVAMLLKELLHKDSLPLPLNLFATDIDEQALQRAEAGTYSFDSVKDMPHMYVKTYFTVQANSYVIAPEIRKLVDFSRYDLLGSKTYAPPDSVFGDFDLVLCRNVLIYVQPEFHERIFDKLYRALASGGYLMLGEAEAPPPGFQGQFTQVNVCCHIYQKVGG